MFIKIVIYTHIPFSCLSFFLLPLKNYAFKNMIKRYPHSNGTFLIDDVEKKIKIQLTVFLGK